MTVKVHFSKIRIKIAFLGIAFSPFKIKKMTFLFLFFFSVSDASEHQKLTLESLSEKLSTLSSQVEKLTSQLEFMSEQLNGISLEKEAIQINSGKSPKKVSVISDPVVNRKLASLSSGEGRVKDLRLDPAWEDYQKGFLMMQAKQYTDAVFHFTFFLSKSADHFLAGHAQFYIASMCFNQKNFTQAIKEYEKVISLYEKSPLIPLALLKLQQSHEALSQEKQAKYYRGLLTEAFSLSPEAIFVSEEKKMALDSSPSEKISEENRDEKRLENMPEVSFGLDPLFEDIKKRS
jgi:TolA-binding protein